jgi:hypothetical protein
MAIASLGLAGSCSNGLIDVVRKDVASAKATGPTVDTFSLSSATTYDGAVPYTIVSSHPGTSASSVTHFLVNESPASPAADDSGWTAAPAASGGTYTATGSCTLGNLGTYGDRTLYAWLKNDLGLVSASATAATSTVHYTQYGAPSVTLTLTSSTPTDDPAITFDLSKSTAGIGGSSIAGWLVNESPTAPAAADIPAGTAPTGYTLALTAGTHTVYAWAKNDTGKVGYASMPVTVNHRTAHLPSYAFIAGHEALTATFDVAMGSASVSGDGIMIPVAGSLATDKLSLPISGSSASSSSLWPSAGGTITVSGTTSYGIPIDAASQGYTVARCVCVSPSGNDTSGLGTVRSPYATVQKGIDRAVALYASSAQVRVAAGTYTSDFSAAAVPVARLADGIDVYGSYSATDFSTRTAISLSVSPTSILTDSSTSVVSATSPYRAVDSFAANNSTLDGFVINSCGASTSFGRAVAAVYLLSSPTISNCWIYGKSSQYYSYGIYFEKTAPTISNCLVQSAAGYNSVGICAYATSSIAPVITGNKIDGGTPGSGNISAGIYLSSGYISAVITRNKISGGYTNTGASYAIYNQASSPVVYNNILLGGKNVNCYGFFNVNGSPVIRNNTIDIGTTSAATPTAAAVHITAGSPAIDNNIFYKSSASTYEYGVYEASAGVAPSSLKNNDFYNFSSSSTFYFNEGTTALATLSDVNNLSLGTNYDLLPNFAGSSDYHLLSASAIKALGLNGAAQSPAWGFDTDLADASRTPLDSSATGWSIGAYEKD